MTAPVDVLAVLDSLIEYHDTSDSLKGRNCIAARAAVAELIEAAKELRDAFVAETNHFAATPFNCISECDEHKRFENRVIEATAKLSITLANVWSAS